MSVYHVISYALLSDLTGVKVAPIATGPREQRVMMRELGSLGATLTPMAESEMPVALQIGVIDAVAVYETADLVALRAQFPSATLQKLDNDVLSGALPWPGGTPGDDTLIGTAGDDLLEGLAGDDLLEGGDGDDTLQGGDGNDTLRGGAGRDTASFLDLGFGVVVQTTDSGTSNTSGDILIDIENLLGTRFNDTLFGDAADNDLRGHDGDDSLFGDLGNDVLFGGAGRDTLQGSDGDDTVHAGDGRDLVNLGNGDDVFFDTGETGAGAGRYGLCRGRARPDRRRRRRRRVFWRHRQ